MTLPIVLSGGVGCRIWPISRENHPKPFIKLDDGYSLTQKAYPSAASALNSDEIITLTNRDLFFYARDEFNELNSSIKQQTFLLETKLILRRKNQNLVLRTKQ